MSRHLPPAAAALSCKAVPLTQPQPPLNPAGLTAEDVLVAIKVMSDPCAAILDDLVHEVRLSSWAAAGAGSCRSSGTHAMVESISLPGTAT